MRMGSVSKAGIVLTISLVLFIIGFGFLLLDSSGFTGAAIGVGSISSGLDTGVIGEDSISEGLDEISATVIEEEVPEESDSSEEEIEPLDEGLVEEEVGVSAIDEEEVTAAVSSCGDISSNSILTDNITASGDCFNISASNLVLDGAGYTITGPGSGIAINAWDVSNVTIKNFANISNFSTAFDIRYIQGPMNISYININDSRILYYYSAGARFSDINITGAGLIAIAINDSLFEFNNFSAGLTRAMDILGINRNLTVRNNHYYDFPTSGYRVSSTTTNSLFENELIVDTDVGIQTNGFANTYRNMTILSCASRAFFDQNDNYEPVQYLTDDASVTWNLTRTTVNSPGEFGFGQLVNISSENINLTTGPTYSSLNDDMEMEFYNQELKQIVVRKI